MKKIAIFLEERREQITTELSRFFNDFELFEATRATPGSLGLSDSYKRLINKHKDEKELFLFEDDVFFTSDKSIEYFTECYNSLPNDWDILLGGSYWFQNPINIGSNLIKVKDFCSMHCIIIKNTTYEHFLNHDTEKQKHIDRYLGELAKENKLNIYLANPMIAIQKPGYSFLANKEVNYTNMLSNKSLLR